MNPPRNTLIVGTAGRDFHVFNTVYRDDSHHRVLGFTSAELCPGDAAHYPSCLSGPLYPDGIPILPEAQLEEIIIGLGVKDVVFAYSELGCQDVAGLAARVLAAGADFQLLSPARSMLAAGKPVIAVTAARAGAGKSPTVRYLAELLHSWGRRVAVVRHPVRIQSFAEGRQHTYAVVDDLEVDCCDRPERAPYESIPDAWVYSGLDYAEILDAAQESADVILWDGAGNDLPFLKPDLHLVLADPLRAGDEVEYFPGEVSLRLADVVLISKCDAAGDDQIDRVESNLYRINPAATVLRADSPVIVTDADNVAGRTVVVVEEARTLHFGALRPGAGIAAAKQVGVSAIISPLPQAVGSLARVYRQHPEAHSLLPTLGYGPEELSELRQTLEATPADAVIDATQVDLAGLLELTRPVAKAAYAIRPHDPQALARLVRTAIERSPGG